jgi:hypothetical protein
MQIETIGRPDHVSLPVIKKAANFYGEYLLQSTRVFNNIHLTIEFEKFDRGSDEYGCCDYVEENCSPKFFHITLEKRLNKKELLLALAHEMVHVKQYAKGEMKDMRRPAHIVKWLGEKYEINEIDYWEQPWEIEAYGREKGLYFKFLNILREEELGFI